MRALPGLMLMLMGFVLNTPALAWDESDRAAYNNKMALLRVLLDGAQHRASASADVQTLCMLVSVGNDVTSRYAQLKPQDVEIEDRLGAMQDDLSMCLTVLYDAQARN